MLTDAKRKKLLAGVLAAVMLTGVAGCGSDKDSEWKNDNAEQEKKDDEGSSGFFHGFFPWFFIGRTFGVGPTAGMYNTQRQQTPSQQQTPQQGAAKQDAAKGAAGQTVQQGSAAGAQKSTLGSTGTSGKSGIGSGLSRSSGSAVS